VAERGAPPAGEYGGHPPSFPEKNPMADCVYAAVHRMQPPALQSVTDCAPAESKLQQLRSCDHAVLSLCQLDNRPIVATEVTFSPYSGLKCTLVAHRVDLRAPRLA
jgi:hypothetical protein